MDYYTTYHSPYRPILLTSDGEALTGLYFQGQKYISPALLVQAGEADLPIFRETKRWLELYFQGKDPGFTPALCLSGTPFRRLVWEILLTIPYGETMSYGEISQRVAQKLGKERMSAQAVGGAVGHNPVSLIVPCHRVLGKDGSLTGYAGGIGLKEKLLTLEGIDVSKRSRPRRGTAL